ncbi:MAG: hypothetical protein U0905_17190 [Pirellulales bacterium]
MGTVDSLEFEEMVLEKSNGKQFGHAALLIKALPIVVIGLIPVPRFGMAELYCWTSECKRVPHSTQNQRQLSPKVVLTTSPFNVEKDNDRFAGQIVFFISPANNQVDASCIPVCLQRELFTNQDLFVLDPFSILAGIDFIEVKC